ncbi:MAG TPA: hypothetical protein VFN30_10705 [Chitinophagaceae bacterium]|nr:hypothetical protein [Chitinophagaceae bacterium]
MFGYINFSKSETFLVTNIRLFEIAVAPINKSVKLCKKDDSVTSAGANADSEQKAENTFRSSHDTKPNVVGLPSSINDIWSHPMNKDVPQKHKQFFNTVKSYLDSCPTNESGKQVIDGDEFVNLLYALGAKLVI